MCQKTARRRYQKRHWPCARFAVLGLRCFGAVARWCEAGSPLPGRAGQVRARDAQMQSARDERTFRPCSATGLCVTNESVKVARYHAQAASHGNTWVSACGDRSRKHVRN